MQVKQVYQIANQLVKQAIGQSEVEIVDSKTFVDWGSTVLNDQEAFDNYVKSMPDLVGKQIFVNRPYAVNIPSVLKDAWEYGSILMKYQAEPLEAIETQRWDLQNGVSYDTNLFYKPTVTAKAYNSKNTFTVAVSYAYDQAKESLLGLSEATAFYSMIETQVINAVSLRTERLIQTTINSAMAEVLNKGKAAMKIGLVTAFNKATGAQLTVGDEKALTNPEFIRFAVYEMGISKDRLKGLTGNYNIGGKLKHTSTDRLNCVMLNDFAKAAGVFLQNGQGQFKDEYLSLPKADTVPFWQGSGDDYSFDSISSINVKDSAGTPTNKKGILAFMFDKDAIAVCNEHKKSISKYNEVGDFYSEWHMYDSSYFVDTDENMIVFTLD